MRFKFAQAINGSSADLHLPEGEGGDATQYTLTDMAILATLAGLTIEMCCNALITIFCRQVQKVSNFWAVSNVIMICFNVTSIIYSAFCVWSLLLGEAECSIVSMVDTALGHLFYVFFDGFMLFKTYLVSHRNKYMLAAVSVLLVNRIVWSFLDTHYSSAEWDDTEKMCVYTQNAWTGVGYNSADTIIDAFATLAVILICYKKFDSLKHAYKALIEKNILRSIVVISMDIFLIWSSENWTSQYLSWLAWFMQNYVLSRALNWDLFWFPVAVTKCNCVKRGDPESAFSSVSIASSTGNVMLERSESVKNIGGGVQEVNIVRTNSVTANGAGVGSVKEVGIRSTLSQRRI
ncbi:hypothetical protein BDR26DRAFT_477720 [Obelidium mucronatum]|nr:hypothetical protein BDR26DRAFT_477720 [Obelidium mucronatum]